MITTKALQMADILCTIFEFIDLDEDHRLSSLYSCLLVNQTWFAASCPILYRAPRVHYQQYSKLLYTLNQHPKYAKFVREVSTPKMSAPLQFLQFIPWCCHQMTVLDIRMLGNVEECSRFALQEFVEWCRLHGDNLRLLKHGHIPDSEAIAVARACYRLERLVIGTCTSPTTMTIKMPNEALTAYSENLSRLLRELSLEFCPWVDDDIAKNWITQFSRLEQLSLRSCPNLRDIRPFGVLSSLTHLELCELSLEIQDYDADVQLRLILPALPKLVWLNIENMAITFTTIHAVPDLVPGLQYFKFGRVSDPWRILQRASMNLEKRLPRCHIEVYENDKDKVYGQ